MYVQICRIIREDTLLYNPVIKKSRMSQHRYRQPQNPIGPIESSSQLNPWQLKKSTNETKTGQTITPRWETNGERGIMMLMPQLSTHNYRKITIYQLRQKRKKQNPTLHKQIPALYLLLARKN